MFYIYEYMDSQSWPPLNFVVAHSDHCKIRFASILASAIANSSRNVAPDTFSQTVLIIF